MFLINLSVFGCGVFFVCFVLGFVYLFLTLIINCDLSVEAHTLNRSITGSAIGSLDV